MEDYIFILIAILLSVFGAINRKKKREEEPVADDSSFAAGKPSPFDDLFSDPLFSRQEVPPPPPSVLKKTKVSESLASPAFKGNPVPQRTAAVRKPVILPEKQQQKKGVHPLMEGFSMKKAVIYSEILQRKY